MPVDTPQIVRLLVACPGCERQYDAGHLAPGSRFRCSCGETVPVPRPRVHEADVVRCSSCGAPRVGAANCCKHCGSDYTLHERDLHTICPRCMARISDRARFCHHCATPIMAQDSAGTPTDRGCPACGATRKLSSRSLGPQQPAVLECPGCAGLWIGQEAFRLISERARSAALPEELLTDPGGPGRRGGATGLQQGPIYRRCPECRNMMNRRNFGKRSGVVIDSCKKHGLWFDSQELERILEWIRDGGEARATKRAEFEQREHERQERTKLDRLEQMAGTGSPSRASMFRGGSRNDSFAGLLGSLFDL